MARQIVSTVLVAFLYARAAAREANCFFSIAAAGNDFGMAAAEIFKMSMDCNQPDRGACSADVKAMLQAIGAAERDVAQAVGDCAGQNALCIASVQKIGDAIGKCGDEAAKLAEHCTPDQNGVFCAADAIMLVGDVVGIAATISQAAKDCKDVMFGNAAKVHTVVV
eukprot:TRINITY_DN82511_c0_g1_i1.p2 TRINITY_DN82511_c0_g1~~TRINITY_DN82511_c0_g1_i1.p2  ORF type:complete len:166 (+),score=43.89 TRINITY_DN82511_c0_g1_i1:172-669(+)